MVHIHLIIFQVVPNIMNPFLSQNLLPDPTVQPIILYSFSRHCDGLTISISPFTWTIFQFSSASLGEALFSNPGSRSHCSRAKNMTQTRGMRMEKNTENRSFLVLVRMLLQLLFYFSQSWAGTPVASAIVGSQFVSVPVI